MLLKASVRQPFAELTSKSSSEQANILQCNLFSAYALELYFLERKGERKKIPPKFPKASSLLLEG